MIIFGTRTMTSSLGGGLFNCPRCGDQRNYNHQQLNRWFTLYFIPCIPMGSAGQYVECMACGGTYGEEILDYDPEAERAEVFALLRRLVVLALLQAQRFGGENIAALRSLLQDQTGEFVTEEQIREDARLAQEAHAQMAHVFQTQGDELTADGKVLLLQLIAGALAPNSAIGMVERQTLNEAGDALGVPRDVVDQIIAG